MGLFRFEEDLLDQARLRIGIGQQGAAELRLIGRGVMGFVPVDEIVRAVRIQVAFGVPVDVGQYRGGDAMALVGHKFTERLQRVVRPPLGQLRAVDLRKKLANRLAQGQR